MSEVDNDHARNLILRALPDEDRSLLARAFETANLETGTFLTERLRPVSRVWFPHSGLVSFTTPTADGRTPETLLVGHEGAVGLEAAVDSPIALADCIVEARGTVSTIRADHLRSLVEARPALRFVVMSYIHSMVAQLMQGVVCNALHSTENRCCRWLLTANDRSGVDTVSITEDALAAKLGVGRPAVNGVLRSLVDSTLIQRRRGMITTLHRAGLVARSCECYRTMNNAIARIHPILLPAKATGR